MLKLSLGPIHYYWPRQTVLAFYDEMAGAPLDIIHLGEVICSKRRELAPRDWLALARALATTGKEIVLSTLTLLEAASELGAMKRLTENGEFLIEANDMGAVNLLSARGRPFSTGPSVNVYNPLTLDTLAGLGLKRWVLPVELGSETLADLRPQVPAGVETEIFGYGRLPLAYSARCFTARAANVAKDHCGFRCLEHPDGQLLRTREDQPFLVINGIQTLSALTHCLAGEMDSLETLGADVVRISPQAAHTAKVIAAFDALRRGAAEVAAADLERWMPVGPCSGYWHAKAGMEP